MNMIAARAALRLRKRIPDYTRIAHEPAPAPAPQVHDKSVYNLTERIRSQARRATIDAYGALGEHADVSPEGLLRFNARFKEIESCHALHGAELESFLDMFARLNRHLK